MVHPTGAQSNFAVGSNVVIIFGTERFDVGANFASNTFTAPVTGKYQLQACIRYDSADEAASYHQLVITTSNKAYPITYSLDVLESDPNYWMFNAIVLADMDASDTAIVHFFSGRGSATTDITADSFFFSGFLAC